MYVRRKADKIQMTFFFAVFQDNYILINYQLYLQSAISCLNFFLCSAIFHDRRRRIPEKRQTHGLYVVVGISHRSRAGERHVSRGGILKYNWRLSPTRAKRYLVTRGPTDRGCYARQSTSGARGGDSPSLCASVCPYGLSRGTRNGEGRGGCIRSLVDAMRRAASSFHTETREALRHGARAIRIDSD